MKYILVLILSFLIIGCSEKNKNPEFEKKSEINKKIKDTLKEDLSKTTRLINNYGWRFEIAGEDQFGTPMVRVLMIRNNKEHYISTGMFNYNMIDTSDYKAFEIPGEALTAARGWWAGTGEDFWVIDNDTMLFVYNRQIDEKTGFGKTVKMKQILLDSAEIK
jgi:hypothetical protein